MTLHNSRPFGSGCSTKGGQMMGEKAKQTKPFPASGTPGNPLTVTVENFPDQLNKSVAGVCHEGTWQTYICIKNLTTNTIVSEQYIDSGVPCTEPQPKDVELFDVDTCIDGVIIREVRQKNFDEEGNAAPSTLVETFNTGIECNNEPGCLKCECWKDKFIEGGLDNTFTSYTHTNQVFSVTFDNGDVGTFNIASATGWTDQVEQMSAGLGGIMPWAQDVSPYCNIAGGCGGLPAPFVQLNKMVARYVGFRVCPGSKVPVSVEYTSDQSAAPKQLVIQYVETDTIFFKKCFDCDGALVSTKTEDGADYEAVCAIPCGEEFPEVPLSQCSVSYLDGCDNVNSTLTSDFVNIVRAVTDCGDGIKVSYLIEDPDGALIDYTLIGDFVDCATGEQIPEPEPECTATLCDVIVDCCDCSDYEGQYQVGTETDISFSSNSNTLKWAKESLNQEGSDFTQKIVDCIDNGGTASITYSDGGVDTHNFDATGYNGDPNTQINFSGTATGTTGSGKLDNASVTCSGCNADECKKALSTTGCNDDRRDELLEDIVDLLQPEDKIEVDVEYLCNSDTDILEQSVTTTTNGVPSTVVTPTTIRCKDLDTSREVEESRTCDPTTGTTHIIATAYLQDGTSVVIGDIDTLEKCCDGTPECVESQEWTYGIDNTGTIYSDVASYVITLSDGSTLSFSQDGSSTSWTPQLQEWSTNIQAAADAAGLGWFVEPRFIDDTNPSNLDGTYPGPGGTPSGLPGAPSIPVAEALSAGGMSWRYVNIQVCPGQPVPVKAERITSDTYTNNPYNLTTAGAILGPIQKFVVCRCCGKAPVWYLSDGVTLASAGQIPDCYEPCGTLTLADNPPDRDITFDTEEGCDNLGQTDQSNFVSVTRRLSIGSDGSISVDYFVEDPADPSALVSYTLIGDFVDCNTGEIIATPTPACNSFELVKLYSLDNITDGLISTQWENIDGQTANDYPNIPAACDYIDNFDYSQVASTPTALVAGNLALNDINNDANSNDIEVKEGYIIVDKPIKVRWYTNSEGAIKIELGLCLGELETMDCHAKTTGNSPTATIDIPKGIHKIRLTNFDYGGSNSSWSSQYSYDGISFTNDSTPPGISYSTTEPEEKCENIKVCEDNGAMIGLLDGQVKSPSDYYDCSIACESSNCLTC